MKTVLFFLILVLILPIVNSYDIKVYGVDNIETDKIRNFLSSEGLNYTYFDMLNISVAMANPHIKNFPTLYVNGVKYLDFDIGLVKQITDVQNPTQEEKVSNTNNLIFTIILLILLVISFIYFKYKNRMREY